MLKFTSAMRADISSGSAVTASMVLIIAAVMIAVVVLIAAILIITEMIAVTMSADALVVAIEVLPLSRLLAALAVFALLDGKDAVFDPRFHDLLDAGDLLAPVVSAVRDLDVEHLGDWVADPVG